MFRACTMVLGVLWLALSGVPSGVAETLYTVTDLGTLPGGSYSKAGGINASGQVVGWADIAGADHAFLYSNGTMSDLGTLGGTISRAYGINTNGQVIGESTDANGNGRAFLYTAGTMTDLGTVVGFPSGATAINGSGQVVGWAGGHAFLYSNGTMTDLGTLSGYAKSCAQAINSGGQVVGWVDDAPVYDYLSRAFLYSNGTMQDLVGTLPGYPYSVARGINDNGEVVGWANTASGATPLRAFLYSISTSTWTDLGTLGGDRSAALAINNSGQIVGGSGHAFLYSNGTMTDLNSLLITPGWTLTGAEAINDNGWIVGQGINPAGETHAFLLTPVPEPSTLALLLTGTIALLGYAWLRRKWAA